MTPAAKWEQVRPTHSVSCSSLLVYLYNVIEIEALNQHLHGERELWSSVQSANCCKTVSFLLAT